MVDQVNISKVAELLQAWFRPFLSILTVALPFLITATRTLTRVWKRLPADTVHLIIGIVFCFFGGLYPALFAAVQAIKLGGWSTFKGALSTLSKEVEIVLEASKKDDDETKTKRRGKEEDETSFMIRKMNLVMTKVNPEKLDEALASLYKIWATVIATLSVKFARTIAMAVTLSNDFQCTVLTIAGPSITSSVPKGYERWVPIVIGWLTKSIAISLVWYLQAIMSAFTSAVEGGLIASRTLLRMCIKKGVTLGGLIPDKHEDTYIDEIVGYLLAATGFYFQFQLGFSVPFPFNFLLLPFETVEVYLRCVITK
jgi:hypothetical protein